MPSSPNKKSPTNGVLLMLSAQWLVVKRPHLGNGCVHTILIRLLACSVVRVLQCLQIPLIVCKMLTAAVS